MAADRVRKSIHKRQRWNVLFSACAAAPSAHLLHASQRYLRGIASKRGVPHPLGPASRPSSGREQIAQKSIANTTAHATFRADARLVSSAFLQPNSFEMRCTVPVPIPRDLATFKIPTCFASCFRTTPCGVVCG
jgi:hypothetical protein